MSLVDEGFAVYAVREEGLSGDVYYLVMYIVLALDDETPVAAADL